MLLLDLAPKASASLLGYTLLNPGVKGIEPLTQPPIAMCIGCVMPLHQTSGTSPRLLDSGTWTHTYHQACRALHPLTVFMVAHRYVTWWLSTPFSSVFLRSYWSSTPELHREPPLSKSGEFLTTLVLDINIHPMPCQHKSIINLKILPLYSFHQMVEVINHQLIIFCKTTKLATKQQFQPADLNRLQFQFIGHLINS